MVARRSGEAIGADLAYSIDGLAEDATPAERNPASKGGPAEERAPDRRMGEPDRSLGAGHRYAVGDLHPDAGWPGCSGLSPWR
jgi:hypothetical protein